MPIVQWNISYLLGIPEIDKHHQHLVQLLNDAYDGFREETDVEPAVIEEIIQCCNRNFAYEEKLMAQSSYPGSDRHKDEHAIFSDRIQELRKSQGRNRNLSIELLWFLCNWVSHHVRETDADLGRFLDGVSVRKKLPVPE